MRKIEFNINEYDGHILGVKGEEFFKRFNFERFENKDGVNWEVIITKTINDSYGESYFNVYIIDSDFMIEPLNCLDENIPLENEPDDWWDYLLKRLCERYIWKHLNYNVGVTYLEDNEVE